MSCKQPLLKFFSVFSFIILFVSSATAADEVRTWSDATGRFKIEAKFVSQADGKVKLEQTNGKTVEIGVKQLSEADQKFLKELESNPFKAADPKNPFMEADSEKDTKSGESPSAAPGKIDWSRSEEIDLDSYGDGWDVAALPEGDLDFVPKTIKLPNRTEFFEGMKSLAISRVARKAAVGYLWTFSTKNNLPRTRVVLCDLEAGRVSGEVMENVEALPVTVHPDGRQVLMRSAKRNEIGLEIWTIQGKRATRDSSWHPFKEEWSRDKELQWARFADEKTLILKHKNGWVTIWDFETRQPVCEFQIDGGCLPALSADGTTLAFYKGQRIGLFDVHTHEVIAMQKAPRKLNWPNLAFSPSQKRLACVAFQDILIWEIETGELYLDFKPAGLVINTAPRFADDDFLLVGNRYLIELENMIKLWDYEGGEQVRAVGGTTFFAVSPQNRPGALMPTLIPHEGAMNALNSALNEPDLFVFRSGSKVKLDVAGINGSHRAEVEASIRAKLAEMDIEIDNNAAVTVKASVSGPKSEEMNYISSGTYTVQIYRTNLELISEGAAIWQSSGTNIPHFVSLNRGENLGDVLREKSKQPAYGFYKKVVLPKFVQKPLGGSQPGKTSGQTIGVSKVVPTTSSSGRTPRGSR